MTDPTKMSREKLEAIARAAQEAMKAIDPTMAYMFSTAPDAKKFAYIPAPEYGRLSDAVRADEQRWQVEANGQIIFGWDLLCDGRPKESFANKAFAERIAALLNEDDARGGK